MMSWSTVLKPRVTAFDALQAVKISIATIQSAQSGKPVRIDEVS